MVTIAIIAWLLAMLTGHVHAAELMAGPMVGHTTTTSADIWVETDQPANVRVDYWTLAGEDPKLVRRHAEGWTADDYPFTGTVTLTGLLPRQRVHYDISVNGHKVRPLTPQTFMTMPDVLHSIEPEEVSAFHVAFGSCLNPSTQPMQPIFTEVLQHRPVAFLFLGDINYMPGHSNHYPVDRDTVRYAMAGYHREVRHVPEVRALMASTPSYGIWDDHDFGPNDADRTFAFRHESLEMYRRYWPNAGAGTATTKGVFHAFKIADVEFFMLDDRYHRDPNQAEDRRTMFGDGQMKWLKDGLKSSTATFKVIANGNSMVVDFHHRHEVWDNFGSERDDFLQWLFDEGINGVFFIVGDWHIGTLNKLYRPGDGYPLFELLSSNAAVRREPIGERPKSGWRDNPQSVAPQYRGYNFGMLRFSGKKGERQVALQIIDAYGSVQIEQLLSESDLKKAEGG
jgi:alkaline phosphatase D